MGHGIQETDSQAFIAKPAWHGKGEVLEEANPARFNCVAACKAAQLEWNVSLAPIQVVDSFIPVEDKDGERDTRYNVTDSVAGRKVRNKYAIYREDTNDIFEIVGKSYYPLQNHQLFSWFQPFLETKQVAMTAMGSLHGGRTVWAQAEIINGDMEIVPGDNMQMKLMLMASHAMEFRTQAVLSPTRVVCQNTMDLATSAGNSQICGWKHTKNQEEVMEKVRETIDTARGQFVMTFEQYKQLAKMDVKIDQQLDYFKVVLDKTSASVHKRTQNMLDDLMHRVQQSQGSDIAGNTLWGCYNAVTNYTTHSACKSQDTRLFSQWMGDNKKLSKRALDIALEIAA